jgi:hypothetical protein
VLTGCPGRYQYNIAFPCGRARSYRVSSSNKSNSPENGLHYVMIPWQESCRIVALSESRRTCSTVSTQFGTQFDMDVSSRRPGTILRRRDRRAQRWRKTPSRGKGAASPGYASRLIHSYSIVTTVATTTPLPWKNQSGTEKRHRLLVLGYGPWCKIIVVGML